MNQENGLKKSAGCDTIQKNMMAYWPLYAIFYNARSVILLSNSYLRLPEKLVTVVSDSLQPMNCAQQASLSMGLPRQEYWSGLPFPSPGHLTGPGIQPKSL